jgi:hypothetical protein
MIQANHKLAESLTLRPSNERKDGASSFSCGAKEAKSRYPRGVARLPFP